MTYETFLSKHMTVREISQLIAEPENRIRGWIQKGILQSAAVLNKMHYVSVEDVPPLKDTVKVEEIMKELGVSRPTAIQYIKDGLIEGGFLFANAWYAPRGNLEVSKKALESNNDLRKNDEFLMPRGAASILGISRATLRKIVESRSMGLNGYKVSKLNPQYWFKRNEVLELKRFFDDLPDNYMSISQISKKYGCSIAAANRILHKTGQVKLAYFNKRFQQVAPIKNIEEIVNHQEFFWLLKPEEPLSIYYLTIDKSPVPNTFLETRKFFDDFFLEKSALSRGSISFQQTAARVNGLCYLEITSLLTDEITKIDDDQIKKIFNLIKTSNSKTIFSHFLIYIEQKGLNKKFKESYAIHTKANLNQWKEVYPLNEYVSCQNYIANIENHIGRALCSMFHISPMCLSPSH